MQKWLLLHRTSLSASATFLSLLPSCPLAPSFPAASGGCPARCPPAAAYTATPAAAFVTIALGSGTRSFFSHRPNYRSCNVGIDARFLLRMMHQREWDAVLEQELAHAGITLTPHIVDQVVACIPSAKLALQFFIWAGEQIGYPPPTSEAAYSITQWYAHKSKVISFLNILRCLADRRFYLSPSRVNVLLQGYGWAGMLDRAYNVMRQERGFSNDMLVNCFLFAIMRQCRYDMVYDVYLEMKKWGTALDICYNSLIQGISSAGGERWQEADHLYRKMMDTGHVPTEATFNALVFSISKAGKHERAYEVFQDMIQKNIKLDKATFSAMVECSSHTTQLQSVSRLVEQAR